jgi:hypothetical protein
MNVIVTLSKRSESFANFPTSHNLRDKNAMNSVSPSNQQFSQWISTAEMRMNLSRRFDFRFLPCRNLVSRCISRWSQTVKLWISYSIRGIPYVQSYFLCCECEICPERNVKKVKHIIEDEIKCLPIVAFLLSCINVLERQSWKWARDVERLHKDCRSGCEEWQVALYRPGNLARRYAVTLNCTAWYGVPPGFGKVRSDQNTEDDQEKSHRSAWLWFCEGDNRRQAFWDSTWFMTNSLPDLRRFHSIFQKLSIGIANLDQIPIFICFPSNSLAITIRSELSAI